MFKDLISYELADGIDEEHLLSVAKKIIEEWMNKLPGFQAWEICKQEDGSYTDVVY